MAQNCGKKFEEVIRRCFEEVSNTSVDRLPDQLGGFKGSSNICDFIIYHYPYQYYIECKSVHGNTLSIHSNNPKHKYGNITNTQWEGLSEKSLIQGVYAGIICWWIDKDVTKFIPIQFLINARENGYKSYRYDMEGIWVPGKKKRIFYNYNMEEFFNEV